MFLLLKFAILAGTADPSLNLFNITFHAGCAPYWLQLFTGLPPTYSLIREGCFPLAGVRSLKRNGLKAYWWKTLVIFFYFYFRAGGRDEWWEWMGQEMGRNSPIMHKAFSFNCLLIVMQFWNFGCSIVYFDWLKKQTICFNKGSSWDSKILCICSTWAYCF